MADLSLEILDQIKGTQLQGLRLPGGFVIPDYGETSILALPASTCDLLGATGFPAPILSQKILDRVSGEVTRVVLVLVDALSYLRLRQWLEEDPSLVWNGLEAGGLLVPLTSVTPSTTSTCLPSIWSGRSPAAHGFVGYELWLKEYGVVANMIKHTPFTIDHPASTLESAGFDPEAALPGPNLGTHLSRSGIGVHAFQPSSIARSGLSRLFLKDAVVHPYISITDLWHSLREAVIREAGRPSFYWVYWGDLDYHSHNHGPDSQRSRSAFYAFTQGFQDIFLRKLSAEQRAGTLIVLTADHGQITTTSDPYYDIKAHPGLERRLHMLPTGENRLIYFFIQPGQTEALRELIERSFPNQFVLIDPISAIESGLFGPGEPHPRLRERLGDLIAIARGNAYLWWSRSENLLQGRHGGLSEDEMLVPFLAARL